MEKVIKFYKNSLENLLILPEPQQKEIWWRLFKLITCDEDFQPSEPSMGYVWKTMVDGLQLANSDKRAVSSAINGAKGGRPKKERAQKNPAGFQYPTVDNEVKTEPLF